MRYLKNYNYAKKLNFNKFKIGDVLRVYYWIRYKKKNVYIVAMVCILLIKKIHILE